MTRKILSWILVFWLGLVIFIFGWRCNIDWMILVGIILSFIPAAILGLDLSIKYFFPSPSATGRTVPKHHGGYFWIAIVAIIIAIAAEVFFLYPHFERWNGIPSWAMLIIWNLLILIMSIVAMVFWIVPLVRKWAEEDYIFTKVDEGTAKAIMGAGGGFIRFVMEYSRHKFANTPDADKWKILEDDAEPGLLIKFWYNVLGFRGIKLLGIPNTQQIYKYQFGWMSLKMTPDGQVVKPHEDEWLDLIMLKTDNYFTILKGAEDKNMLPLDIGLNFIMQVEDPSKALFGAEKWLELASSRLLPAYREFTTLMPWKELQQCAKEKHKALMEKDSTEEIKNYLKQKCGVIVIDVEMAYINPGGANAEEYEKAAAKKYLAEQEAEAVRAAADGKAYEKVTLATAEKTRIQETFGAIKEFGPLGEQLAYLEAIKGSQEQQGSKWILDIGGRLGGFLKGIGINPDEQPDKKDKKGGKS